MKNETSPHILFITSYPPRECGLATYSQDLIKSLNNKFEDSFNISICALTSDSQQHKYSEKVSYILNTDQPNSFVRLARTINESESIKMVMIQHEFGFFEGIENDFKEFLYTLSKPIIIAFHTVLPLPSATLKTEVRAIVAAADSVVVMTHFSEAILMTDYEIPQHKITVIAHGTHLVPHSDKGFLKAKYNLAGRTVLSTFGLLSSGKNIETTLDALPAIIQKKNNVLFLIIGKTHPSVVEHEGERYRQMLEKKIAELQLQNHVRFVNKFLPLPDLLEYLQLTDIYLFTSKDPNQAVSGTFSYAISCGCPIISTPIPHAREVLQDDAGVIIDFGNSKQLSNAVNKLLANDQCRKNMSSRGLHRIVPTAWENSAIAHALLFEKISKNQILLHYCIPTINLDHIKRLTTDFGMIQFSVINQPDIDSGYTLDDNARAMVAMCQHYELTNDSADLVYIELYLNFITYCLQPNGYFLNYVDEKGHFTIQNHQTNLADSNGRAIWALGYLISLRDLLPKTLISAAETTIKKALVNVHKIHSTRAMAFIIKGLYYASLKNESAYLVLLLRQLADRLVQMYRHEAEPNWKWYESYLTYGNSILPEALLCAWLATGEQVYKQIAKSSFDFLLTKIFTETSIKVISNKGWLQKTNHANHHSSVIGGEQPIDIAYTILALRKFYDVFEDPHYKQSMNLAFDWFLGNNHLNQIIYNPCTGGCYDGLEDTYVNLNQGAESTVSYLMARVTVADKASIETKTGKQDLGQLSFKKPQQVVFNSVRIGI
jgi:glycosyltransferase involved in cell wall biosynthesis